MDDRSEKLKAQNQAALIQFLNADLDLAFTFLETAMIEAEFDLEEVPAVLERVRNALRTVRALTERIQDQTIGAQIHSRADEVEAALAKFALS